MVEAWQLLVEDAPDGSTRLSLAEFCELLQDPPSLAGVAAIWTWLQSSQSLFRWRRDRLVQPLTLDERVASGSSGNPPARWLNGSSDNWS